MKITKSQLKQIIKEELESVLAEQEEDCYGARRATEEEIQAWSRIMASDRDYRDVKGPSLDHRGVVEAIPGDLPKNAWLDTQTKIWMVCPGQN